MGRILYPSKYNHLIKVEPLQGSTVGVVCNLFFGAASFINETVYSALLDSEQNGRITEEGLPEEAQQYLLERGFAWSNPEAEEQMLINAVNSFGDRDQLAAGLKGGHYGFITSLYCNLACPYCFQRTKADSCGFMTLEQIDLGLDAIARCEERAAYLTHGEATLPKISITGGEPLLRNSANLEVLEYLLSRLQELQWPYSITTNGTTLSNFVAEHKPTSNCRNIQVTLDGPRSVHDQRRCFRNGMPSFDCICESLEAALAEGWIITLRANLDMSNVNHLPALAEFVQSKGWLDQENFYAYASPVTDHGSLGGDKTPKDEADLLEALLQVIDRSPKVRKAFDIRHFRGFDYVERILLHKNPKHPVFYRCEAVIGMYIFDPFGDIHVCLETAGDRSLRIGTYDPEWIIDDKAFLRWTQRNVLTMQECSNCKIRFICAGGCTIESLNHANTACCMPFLREMDLAWKHFAKTKPELFL